MTEGPVGRFPRLLGSFCEDLFLDGEKSFASGGLRSYLPPEGKKVDFSSLEAGAACGGR